MGGTLDKERNIPDWLKGIIVQFIELIGEAEILDDLNTKGEKFWGRRGDLVTHKEWALENKQAYAFIYDIVVNWDNLNKYWRRNDMAEFWRRDLERSRPQIS